MFNKVISVCSYVTRRFQRYIFKASIVILFHDIIKLNFYFKVTLKIMENKEKLMYVFINKFKRTDIGESRAVGVPARIPPRTFAEGCSGTKVTFPLKTITLHWYK